MQKLPNVLPFICQYSNMLLCFCHIYSLIWEELLFLCPFVHELLYFAMIQTAVQYLVNSKAYVTRRGNLLESIRRQLESHPVVHYTLFLDAKQQGLLHFGQKIL